MLDISGTKLIGPDVVSGMLPIFVILPDPLRRIRLGTGLVTRARLSPGIIVAISGRIGRPQIERGPADAGRKPQVDGVGNRYPDLASRPFASIQRHDDNVGLAGSDTAHFSRHGNLGDPLVVADPIEGLMGQALGAKRSLKGDGCAQCQVEFGLVQGQALRHGWEVSVDRTDGHAHFAVA